MRKTIKEPEPEAPKKPARKKPVKKPTDSKSQVINQMKATVETQPVPLAQAAESYVKAQAEPATITNMKEIVEKMQPVVEKPVEPEPLSEKITDEAKHIEEEAVDKAKGTWEKVKGVFTFHVPTKFLVIAAIIFCTVGGIYILCRALETKARQERSAVVKAKMDELAKKLVEVSSEITKGEAKVYVDQETAEAYKNDRVAFENSMKSKRLVNLNEHDEVQNKVDSAHNIDAIRNLLDTILTIKAQ